MEMAEICSHRSRHIYLHMDLSSLLIVLCQHHPYKLTECLISSRYCPQYFFWGRNYSHCKRLQQWAHAHGIISLTSYPITQKWLACWNVEWLIDSIIAPVGKQLCEKMGFCLIWCNICFIAETIIWCFLPHTQNAWVQESRKWLWEWTLSLLLPVTH